MPVFTVTPYQTIQQIKSRIKEIKEYKYSNRLAKVHIFAKFRAGDSRLLRAHQYMYLITQRLRNLTLLCHKTKSGIKLKMCEKISLKLL